MLSLTNSSICDVCAEEYTATRVPHCIPCGHILCKACCNTIIEKTQPGRQPVCPFCRLNFQADGIRKLRLDLNASMSGPSTPRHRSGSIEANHVHEPTTWLKKDAGIPTSEKDRVRYRGEIRHLEDKVARIAAKRCSVEEVSVVLKEVEHCLRALGDEQPMSLVLSSALLRAILTNYHAHDQATKTMKSIENNLKAQVSDLENAAGNLQAELRKVKTQQTQKAQECQTLRVELNRSKIKAAASSLALPNSALGLSATSFGSAGDAVYSDSSRPTSPTSPTYDSRSSSRSQTPSVIGSPLRHLVALPPSLPSSTHQTPVTSPIMSPHGSPGYISSPRYTSASGVASPPPGQYRASSVMGHRTASSTSTVSSSSSAASGIDRSRTPVASAYSPVAQPTSPPRSSRSSSTLPAPPIFRSTSDEEQDMPRSHISSGSSSSRTKERTTLAAGFVQRWLPGSSDRSSSTPPVMPGSRPSHGRTPSMQAYISKTSTASPLSASAAARSVRA